MSYIGTTINSSPTITGKAAATIADGAFLAAAFDKDGTIEVAKADAGALGIFIAETDNIKAGADVTVQVKDIGLWKTGASVKAGAELMSDANGKAVTATAGKFVLAVALEAATAADQIIQVQICKAGYKAAVSE